MIELPNENEVLPEGSNVTSPGGNLQYRIVGAVCRLYDREELPYPSCSLDWRGKQPSWRRIGVRFVPDMSSKRSPSYSVEYLDDFDNVAFNKVITLYYVQLSPAMRQWWHTPRSEKLFKSCTIQSVKENEKSGNLDGKEKCVN